VERSIKNAKNILSKMESMRGNSVMIDFKNYPANADIMSSVLNETSYLASRKTSLALSVPYESNGRP